MTTQTLERIRDYIDENPYVVFAVRVAGSFDVQLTIYAKGTNHFYEILTDIRKTFGTAITNYEFLIIINELKESYLTNE